MHIRRTLGAALVSTALLAYGVTPSFAQNAVPTAPAVRPGIDPKADDVLRRMGASLAKATTFSFTVHDFTDQVLDSGQKVQLAKTIKVLVRRPDALVTDTKGDVVDRRFVYSGTKIDLLDRADNVYAEQTVPGKIEDMFDFLASKFGITAPLSDLAFPDPYAVLTERVRQGVYLGVHDVMGTKCHHLAFRQEGLDWQIWLDDTPESLPRKVVITYKEQPGHPQYTAILSDWNLNAVPADDAFKFVPPDGAKREDLQANDEPTTKPAAEKK
jgi:hypothetical protein